MTIRVQDVIHHRPDKGKDTEAYWGRTLILTDERLPPVDTKYEVTFHKNGQILLNPINHGKDHRDPGDPSQ